MPLIKVPFELLDEEELLLVTRPHPLAMTGLMLFWLGIGALGVVFIIEYPRLTGGLGQVKFLGPVAARVYDVIWVAALLVPLVLMAVFRINFKYVIVLALLLAARVLIAWKGYELLGINPDPHPHLENYLLIAVGLLGIIGVEFFRRGHRYYLTNKRIVARFGRVSVSERSTLYSKIDDLVLQKPFLGRLFNFGTVIPITSTGLGMGQDLAVAGATAGAGKGPLSAGLFAAGGKVKNVPRDLSLYVLYRIKNPEQARNLIMEEMENREGARNPRSS